MASRDRVGLRFFLDRVKRAREVCFTERKVLELNCGGGSGGATMVKARKVGCGGRRMLKSSKNVIDTPIYRLGGKKDLVGKFSDNRRRNLLVLAGIYEFFGDGVEREEFGVSVCFYKMNKNKNKEV